MPLTRTNTKMLAARIHRDQRPELRHELAQLARVTDSRTDVISSRPSSVPESIMPGTRANPWRQPRACLWAPRFWRRYRRFFPSWTSTETPFISAPGDRVDVGVADHERVVRRRPRGHGTSHQKLQGSSCSRPPLRLLPLLVLLSLIEQFSASRPAWRAGRVTSWSRSK